MHSDLLQTVSWKATVTVENGYHHTFCNSSMEFNSTMVDQIYFTVLNSFGHWNVILGVGDHVYLEPHNQKARVRLDRDVGTKALEVKIRQRWRAGLDLWIGKERREERRASPFVNPSFYLKRNPRTEKIHFHSQLMVDRHWRRHLHYYSAALTKVKEWLAEGKSTPACLIAYAKAGFFYCYVKLYPTLWST